MWTPPKLCAGSKPAAYARGEVGNFHPRRMAAIRSAKQSTAPPAVVHAGGNPHIPPTTTTAAPASAATAYNSARNTVGISLISKSRTIPPPIPVSIPSNAACTGSMPYVNAFCVPATANSPRPAASNVNTGVRNRSTLGCQ